MKVLNFLFQKRIIAELKKKNKISINVLCYENNMAYPIYLSDQKFENCMDLFLVTDENKFHYVYTKDFNRLMCNKAKNKNKKYFSNVVYNVLVVKKV